MNSLPSSEHDGQDEVVIRLLKDWGASEAAYPLEALTARRAAYLEQVERLVIETAGEELSPADQEIVTLLAAAARSTQADYPANLLSGRHSDFVRQIETAGQPSVADGLRLFLQQTLVVPLLKGISSLARHLPDGAPAPSGTVPRENTTGTKEKVSWRPGTLSLLPILGVFLWLKPDRRGEGFPADKGRARIFPSVTKTPALSAAGFMRLSLVTASLIFALFLRSWFTHSQPILPASPVQAARTPTSVLPTGTSEAASASCEPGDQNSACWPENWDPGQDLADSGGAARPAVSNDAYPVLTVKYVNDGRADTSWVSKRADSWIKIDLGQTRTINMVNLEKGQLASAPDADPGGFVIAVALSDVYADGDSQGDDREYAQVFDSEGAGAGDTASDAGLISTHFSPVEARFVKITFEKEGAAIGEVRVFMAAAPGLAEQPTRIPRDDPPGIASTPIPTNTLPATETATPVPSATSVSTDAPTAAPTTTAVPSQTPTNPPEPSETPTELPTSTPPPIETSTPASLPLVLPTEVPPGAIKPTTIPPTIESAFVSTEPIVVTESDQTLTFTCKGNAVAIRGHANTITLLGSCSSITVTGTRNHVFWQFGSPVITVKGDDNIVLQL